MKIKQLVIAASVASFFSTAHSSSLISLSAQGGDLNHESAIQILVDNKESFNKLQRGIYAVKLPGKGALLDDIKRGNKVTVDTTQIEKSQSEVIEQLKFIDSGVQILQRLKLVENAVHVNSTEAALKHLQAQFSGVSYVKLKDASSDSHLQKPEGKALVSKVKAEDINVAILSSGIDYTHAALGGEGTVEAYQLAMDNFVNGWDGFPTEVVVDGLDFVSELGGYFDYNPIALDQEYQDQYSGYVYPTGLGTRIASSVLAKAPNAKIMAYKIYGYVNGQVFGGDRVTISLALERAMDPNGDGDISDRADILLIDSGRLLGYFNSDDAAHSGDTYLTLLLKNLSAMGTLVVAPAGENQVESHFNISQTGVHPDSLTVASANQVDGNIIPSAYSPYGPARGDQVLKPDLMALGENVTVASVGTGNGMEQTSGAFIAAAQVAGEIAQLMIERPELNALQAKAILMNTANPQVVYDNSNLDTNAPITRQGAGLSNVNAALSSPVLVWNKDNFQANLYFGFADVANSKTLVKNMAIQNLSDMPQSYRLSSSFNRSNNNNAAVSLSFPDTLTVASNSTVNFSVLMTLDDAKISDWAMGSNDEYTMDNWAKIEVDGHLTLTSANGESPTLNLPFMVIPKGQGDLDAIPLSHLDEYSTVFSQDWGMGSSSGILENFIELQNNSSRNQTYAVLPIMGSVETAKADTKGNMFERVAGGIYDEAQCESGKKLVIGAQFFESFDLLAANHWERGIRMFQVKAYPKWVVDQYGPDAANIELNIWSDDMVVFTMFVELNEVGKPETYFLDLSQPYDNTQPYARYKTSSLPTLAAPGSRTVVSSICTSDLYHHSYDSDSAFDEKLGFQFSSDRAALPDYGEDIIQYNPMQYGGLESETVFDPWWGTQTYNYHSGSKAGIANTTNVERAPRFSLVDYEYPISDQLSYLPFIDLPPGEMAQVRIATDFLCSNSGGGIGVSVSVDCPFSEVMLFNTETPFFKTQNLSEGSVIAYPESGQTFVVSENAPDGSLIGQIAVGNRYLYAIEGKTVELYLANSIPGTPFILSKEGNIYVHDSSTIDYEQNDQFELMVYAREGNTLSKTVPVTINLLNQADIAPELLAAIPTIEGIQSSALSFALDVYFKDQEGDLLTFFSSDLPAGLSVSEFGELSGIPEESGEFNAVLNISDGAQSLDVTLTFAIAAAPAPQATTSSGSGSLGLLLLGIFTLCISRRR